MGRAGPECKELAKGLRLGLQVGVLSCGLRASHHAPPVPSALQQKVSCMLASHSPSVLCPLLLGRQTPTQSTKPM